MKRRSLFIARIIVISFFLRSLQSCLGQTDTNLLATGDWSEIVRDSDAHARYALRGRLLVYDDQPRSAASHARVYLELQNIFEGGWSLPLELYFDLGFPVGRRGDLYFEMRDALDRPLPPQPVSIRSIWTPEPYHIILPCDSTVRLRADMYNLGSGSKPDGLEILVSDGQWNIPPNATNDFFLSATLVAPKDRPVPLKYPHVWAGTLKLPKVKIPVRKQ
jgi:hypothetical protein